MEEYKENKTNELDDIATLRLVTDAYKVSHPIKMLLLRYILKRIKKKLPLAFVSYLLIDELGDNKCVKGGLKDA